METKTEVYYGTEDTFEAAKAKALVDMKEAFGEQRYDSLVSMFKEQKEPANVMTFQTYFAILGVQGFMVFALYDMLWPEVETVKKINEEMSKDFTKLTKTVQ